MDILPYDVIVYIFNKLNTIDLITYLQTCKYINNIPYNDWKNRLPKTYLRKKGITNDYKIACIRYEYYKNNSDKLGIRINKQYKCRKINSIKKIITTIPNTTFIFKDLLILDIRNNTLKSLPISHLTTLTVLNISDNFLTEFPKSIYSLINLKRLNLSGNPIKELHNISMLTNLKYLNLSSCSLKIISADIILLNLSELYINRNDLITIPDWIYTSNSLTKINLSYNPGLIFSNNFCSNINLRTLTLNYCQTWYFSGILVNKLTHRDYI